MHLCLLQHLPRQMVLQQYTSLSLSCLLSSFLLLLQICQCPVTFCCIDSLDGFCVKILFLCLFFLLVHCTVDIYHFLPWLLTIFQCSFQEKKKSIYIYILVYHENPKTIHLGSIHFCHFLRYSPDSQKEETQLELNVSTADSI